MVLVDKVILCNKYYVKNQLLTKMRYFFIFTGPISLSSRGTVIIGLYVALLFTFPSVGLVRPSIHPSIH